MLRTLLLGLSLAVTTMVTCQSAKAGGWDDKEAGWYLVARVTAQGHNEPTPYNYEEPYPDSMTCLEAMDSEDFKETFRIWVVWEYQQHKGELEISVPYCFRVDGPGIPI